MDVPFLVHEVEPHHNLLYHIGNNFHGVDLSFIVQLLQSDALDQLQDDVEGVVLVKVLHHLHDVRVVQVL